MKKRVSDNKKPVRKTYREENGTTRVGDFLRKIGGVAPEILDVAGKVTGIGALNVLSDKIKKTDTLSDFEKEIALKELEQDIAEMKEVTSRLKSDNEHTITRLIRPLSYGMMFILFLSAVFLDGNIGEFKIKDVYIPVIETLFSTMTIFYFGSRGIEKVIKTWSNSK